MNLPFDLAAQLHPTWWETLAVALVAVALFVSSRLGLRFRAPRLARVLYGSERRAIVAVGLISLGAAILCTSIRSQRPRVHDEFSYLLAADTFAHGRLTNPTHPMSRHLETLHILMEPTMQSKYPPAQGLALAAGQVVTGRPIAGVWASFSLACMALYWCLRSWTPRRWAFFGGLLPCLRFGTGLYYRDSHWAYWSSTYWGGAVALLGGCLLLGAGFRMFSGRAGKRESVLLGAGLSILAASRPWEGLALAAPLLLVVIWRLAKQGSPASVARNLAPALATAALALCALGYYNSRVTGSLLTMPYQAYMQRYDVVPVFRFQTFRPEPIYHNESMREYHLEFQTMIAQSQLDGFGLSLEDIRGLAAFFLGRPLTGAAVLGLCFWRDRRLLLVGLLLAISGASHAVTLITPYWPHYFAPYVPLVLLPVLRGLRLIRSGRLAGARPGRFIAWATVIATAGALIVSAALRATNVPNRGNGFSVRRQAIVDRLLAESGDDLVIVRYSSRHFVHSEWVYNLSDIDSQPIVWAHDMGPSENQELLDYFPNRRAWLLEPDLKRPSLTPYATNLGASVP